VQGLLPVLRVIADETGCGVLLVEQHVQQALKVAERAYVLAHGSLVLDTTTERLRNDTQLLESSYLGVSASSTTTNNSNTVRSAHLQGEP
jgi:branched-chain amino acid transport system ATP-binding protein